MQNLPSVKTFALLLFLLSTLFSLNTPGQAPAPDLGCGKAKNDADIATYTKAIQVSPSDYNAYVNRGKAYLENSDHEAALKDFNKAIELLPMADAAYLERGRLFSYRTMDQRAIEDLTKAIELNPFNSEAYAERAHARWGIEAMRRNRDFSLMFSDLSVALELSPNDASAYNTRGAALSVMNQRQEAVADWNKAIEILTATITKGEKKPCDLNPYLSRAYAYGQLGLYKEGLSDINLVIEKYPDYFRGYLVRAILMYRQRKSEPAIADFSKVIELNPNFASSYQNRASNYKYLGQKEKAEADLKKFKELRTTVPGMQPAQ